MYVFKRCLFALSFVLALCDMTSVVVYPKSTVHPNHFCYPSDAVTGQSVNNFSPDNAYVSFSQNIAGLVGA